MNLEVVVTLFNNAILLLVLSVIYEITYFIPSRYRHLQPIFSGLLISVVCVVIMSMPLMFQFGIIFDTRSILISVTALMFGPVPTAVVVTVASLYRLSIGGVGVLPGLTVILTSALVGLVWRRWLYEKSTKWRWLSIYAMSIVVHFIMLDSMLLLPSGDSLNVINKIALPVMLVFPVTSVLLSLLLMHQQTHREIQSQLKQSERRFQDLFYQAPLAYQSLDIEGRFIEVNQQWLDLFGYSRDEVVGKWFGDFVSPEYVDEFREQFLLYKKQGYTHGELEMLQKGGEKIFIAFEGKIKYGPDGKFIQTYSLLQDMTKQKMAEAALVNSEKKYRYIAENMSDVIWQMDINLNAMYVSPSVEKLTGETHEEHLKKTAKERFPTQSIEKLRSVISDEIEIEKDPKIDKNRSRRLEVEYYKADGTVGWVGMNISIMRDEHNKMIGFQGVSRDITQHKKTEIKLSESERSKSVLLSNLPGMAYRCNYDREWTMQFVSDGCLELTGYPPESLLNNRDLSFYALIAPQYRDLLFEEWELALAAKLQFKYEYEIITADGKHKWVLEMGEGVYDKNGQVEMLEGIIIDIQDRKENEIKIKFSNEHNLWTGLYNLRYFENILNSDAGNTSGEKRAVVGIDLNSIYPLRMAYGFRYSQKLVKRVADALKRHESCSHQLFHIYENQFAFYLNAYKDTDGLRAFCEAIVDTLESILTVERVGGNIGVVEINAENEFNTDQILRSLMIASDNADNNSDIDFAFCFYNIQMEAQLMREKAIEHELSQIAAGESADRLFLQFQPILDIKTNMIKGFEALARLNSDSYGMVSPLEFIPIAEKTKLILPLGEQIIFKALGFISRLRVKGYDDITVAINISVIQLLRDNFAKKLFAMIVDMHLNPELVFIEITESIFSLNYPKINQVLGELKGIGINISIDDFGTGYSSLARVRELNVNCLKIDKLFIDKLLTLKHKQSITGDIIAMAHKLDYKVIAEGVEEESQLQYLREQGCDEIQGYLISKPIDEETSFEFLKNINKRLLYNSN